MENPAFLSDFNLLGSNSTIIDKGSFMVIKTKDNPTYMGGNFLLLKTPPKNSEKNKIEKLFKENFESDVVKSHIAFSWEKEPSDLSDFMTNGYEYITHSVLTMKPSDFILPSKTNSEITIELIDTPSKWGKWILNEIDERPESISKSDFTAFIKNRARFFKEQSRKGNGEFYGAFLENRLVGSVGFFIYNRVGRFQIVRTINEFRRKYICNSLLKFILLENASKIDTAVIVTDKNYVALNLYKKLGFKETHIQYELIKKL